MSKVAFEQDLSGIKLILVKMNNCFHKNLSAICQQIVRRQTTNSQLKVQKNELQKRRTWKNERWVLNRIWTHDLPITRRALYSVSYEELMQSEAMY